MRIEQFHERHLDGATALLAEMLGLQADDTGVRYRLSDAASARAVIADATRLGPGVVALDDDVVVGYMIAPVPSVPAASGSRMKVVHHAASSPVARDVYRQMYQRIAATLVTVGCFDHTVLVPIDQPIVLEALFELQFGIDQIKGVRPLPDAADTPPGDRIRPAQLDDVDRLVELHIELIQFHSRSPMLAPSLIDVARIPRTLAHQITAADNIVLVACDGDTIIGMIQAAPDGLWAATTTIGMNVVTEHARSARVGTTMLNALYASAASSGAEQCAVGWDSANPLSDQFYRTRGFTPVRYELRRIIDSRVAWANENLDYHQVNPQPEAR